MKINSNEIFANIEAKYRHVVYNARTDKIILTTDAYRCMDTRADWADYHDGVYKLRTNDRRIRLKTFKKSEWVYICKK